MRVFRIVLVFFALSALGSAHARAFDTDRACRTPDGPDAPLECDLRAWWGDLIRSFLWVG